jgi:hypothetical protein
MTSGEQKLEARNRFARDRVDKPRAMRAVRRRNTFTEKRPCGSRTTGAIRRVLEIGGSGGNGGAALYLVNRSLGRNSFGFVRKQVKSCRS